MSDTNITCLVDEYRKAFGKLDHSDPRAIEHALVNDADWTPDTARQLIQLAQDFGAFVLRNATAIATALEIEDGELRL